uniref:Uncharacterized protein n=1 Tax=Oryza nivara TaxID=4536 RepID=A0A0E0G417_ORYNI
MSREVMKTDGLMMACAPCSNGSREISIRSVIFHTTSPEEHTNSVPRVNVKVYVVLQSHW